MKRQKQTIRRKFNPNCQKDAPTVWYIAEDGAFTQNESEAKNKIRRNRKFKFYTDSNGHNRYVEEK